MPKLKKPGIHSDPSQNGFPKPKKVNCFQCAKQFFIKYVVPNKSYSKKNNWEYWTNPATKDPNFWKNKEQRQKDKQICDTCLRKFYYDKEVYWATITDLKIRGKLKSYIHNGLIA
jgi:hypothetical protein